LLAAVVIALSGRRRRGDGLVVIITPIFLAIALARNFGKPSEKRGGCGAGQGHRADYEVVAVESDGGRPPVRNSRRRERTTIVGISWDDTSYV
jgi:hypothetical protein